jgi:hypothetical protein
VVIGVMLVSVIAVRFFAQGRVAPLTLVPLGLGWMALQRFMAHSERARSDRPLGDTAGTRRRLLPIAAFVVLGAVWFMLVMQLVTGYA